MCDFQSLYFSDDGYVVCCKQCHYYQVAFGNILLNLEQVSFSALCEMIKYAYNNEESSSMANKKSIVIPTNSQEIYLLLTKRETSRLLHILEEADNELKAQSLLRLFN